MSRKGDLMNMNDTLKKSILVLVLAPLIAASEQPAAGVSSTPAFRATKEKPFRARLGFLGGVVMQKPQFEVAVAWDVAKISQRLRLVGDFTVGLRPNEITLEPMAGVRFPIELKNLPKLEPWVGALLGVNLTFMRGGTAVALPLRLVAGLHYEVVDNLALGFEVSAEFGPLVAPFAHGYAAIHLGVVAAWAF